MITHIHSTTIVVADQDKALDFYVNVLGWQKISDNVMGPTMRWLTVSPPGAVTQLVLGAPSWFPPEDTGDFDPPEDRRGFKVGGRTGIALIAPDIDETYADLVKKGVKFKQPVTSMPWGAKGTWFEDLDGNEFFLASA